MKIERISKALVYPFMFCLLSLVGPVQADEVQGKKLYVAICSQCHGITGEGNGINAPELEVVPRNHTDRGEMAARTDEDLFKAIAEGGQAINKSILMPNWGNHLSEQDINDLVAWLRVLCCSN